MCQIRGFIAGVASAAALGAIAMSLGFAQSGKDTKPVPKPPSKDKIPAPPVPGGVGEVQVPPEVAAAMELMKPGPEHKWLAERNGTWNATTRMWMGPGEPEVNKGKADYSMVEGGRFRLEKVNSTFMGEPFSATSLTGFNRQTKQFEIVWVDSSGTAMTMGKGTRSSDGKVLTTRWEFLDPMGKPMAAKLVDTTIDADHFKLEMFGNGPDGSEMKMMENTYERAK